MRKSIIVIILFLGIIIYGQNRLSFMKNDTIKIELQKSIDYLNKSIIVPQEIKNKVVFITIDFDDIFGQEIESFGINYSTYLPTLFSKFNNGQFEVDKKFGISFYNYSKNIVLVFLKDRGILIKIK